MICAEWISSQTAWVWGQKAPVTTNISMGEIQEMFKSIYIHWAMRVCKGHTQDEAHLQIQWFCKDQGQSQ